MQHKSIAVVILLLAVLVEAILFLQLLGASPVTLNSVVWIALHTVAAACAAVAIALHVSLSSDGRQRGSFIHFFALAFSFSWALPLIGALGGFASLVCGIHFAEKRHRQSVFWQFTDNPDLPFTTPIGRQSTNYDNRGFSEQFAYSQDHQDIYRKVLSAANIRSSLSVDALKKAVLHPDERVRLTAYQSLDRKVTSLNLEIQKLESTVVAQKGQDKSNTWLQIASNYWELLTLEKDEPVARRLLLEKAAAASSHAIAIMPENRNAHFTLGRVALFQGDLALAKKSLVNAAKHGMPKEVLLPYMAEVAFEEGEYTDVKKLLSLIDSSFTKYPPLKPVMEYWS